MAYQSEIEKLQRRYEEKPEQWFAAYADAYRKAGELDVALEIVRSGIEERPNYVSGYIVLGRCLVDQGEDDEAREAFEQVLALDAENIIALSNLGEVAERAGDVTTARGWLERLLEVDPMNERARERLEGLAAAPPTPVEPEAPAKSEPAAPTGAVEPVAEAPAAEAPGGPPPAEPEAQPTERSPASEAAESGGDAAPPPEPPAPREEDLPSVFAPPPPPSEPAVSEPARRTEGADFLIEQQSDPFQTAGDAQQAEKDAAALWATLGKDPELASVRESEAEPSGASGPPADPGDLGDIPTFESAEEEVQSIPPPREPEEEAATAGGTTQMSAAELNRLVEEERREVQERRDAPGGAEPPADEHLDVSDDVIGGPPPEYQLEAAGPESASPSVPVFADPDLLADDTGIPPDAEGVQAPPAVERPEGFLAYDETPARQESNIEAMAEEPPAADDTVTAQDANDVVTETMAEVYAAQGLFEEARGVYRKLLERRPGDPELGSRLSALEDREREAQRTADRAAPVAEPATREYAASRTGGVSARGFLSALLAERPSVVSVETGIEPEANTTVLDETFASDRSDSEGEPTRPAGDEMSLASVFGDGTPDTGEHDRPAAEQVSEPPPPAPPASQASQNDEDMSFDNFFGGGDDSAAGGPPSEGVSESDDDDDEDFKAWLKSLKS